jgi:hypothetical protein
MPVVELVSPVLTLVVVHGRVLTGVGLKALLSLKSLLPLEGLLSLETLLWLLGLDALLCLDILLRLRLDALRCRLALEIAGADSLLRVRARLA